MEIENVNGNFENLITPSSTYKWEESYWTLTISADEDKIFFSSINANDIGCIWTWDAGTTNNIKCIELGNLYLPFFILKYNQDNVFIDAYDKNLSGVLYFVSVNIDTELFNWGK